MMHRSPCVWVLLIGTAVVGCARHADLTPIPGPRRVTAESAVSHVAGAQVKARTDAWPGLSSVKDHVTPLRVTLVNESDVAIRVRYCDCALIAPAGQRYAALPPFDIRGTARDPYLARQYR